MALDTPGRSDDRIPAHCHLFPVPAEPRPAARRPRNGQPGAGPASLPSGTSPAESSSTRSAPGSSPKATPLACLPVAARTAPPTAPKCCSHAPRTPPEPPPAAAPSPLHLPPGLGRSRSSKHPGFHPANSVNSRNPHTGESHVRAHYPGSIFFLILAIYFSITQARRPSGDVIPATPEMAGTRSAMDGWVRRYSEPAPLTWPAELRGRT